MPKREGGMQDRTYVPLRPGRYLHVHGVVTCGEANCARDGANVTGGGDTAKTCETSQARGWFSTWSPEPGHADSTHIDDILLEPTDPRPGSRAGGRTILEPRVKCVNRHVDGEPCDSFGLRELCNDDHEVKLDVQNPSPAAFATRSAASWRLRDEAMPRCRAPNEGGTIYAE